MKWHELSFSALENCSRNLPVIVPLGSCEQHGHHLPLFVDSLQVQALVDGIETTLGDKCLTLPVAWLGASHHHLDFCGTVSLSPSVYASVIQEITTCLLHHGFWRILFLNGHGGNLIPASHALSDLISNNDDADAAEIALASWWTLAAEPMAADHLRMHTDQLTHACEFETSLILALRPDLVNISKLQSDAVEKERPWATDARWGGKVQCFHRFHRWTSSGHMGEPSFASKEKGQNLLSIVTNTLVDFIKDYSRWPRMDVSERVTPEP